MPADTQTAEALLLIQAQSQARQQIRDATQAAVVAQVRSFHGWYDGAAITALAGRLSKLTKAGQRQTAASTDAFALQILRLLTGKRPGGTKPIDVSSGLRRGVPLESVYGRLADNYRWLEATRGVSAPEALLERVDTAPLSRLSVEQIVDRVIIRAGVQADDNLSLAFRDQWAANLDVAPDVVTGYRRILHPELSAGGSCGLCVVASDHFYHRAELLPLHSRCACTVMAVVGDPHGDGDPGVAINAADLKLVYEKAGGTTAGRALKKTRFTVVQDGELGPRLAYRDQHHRTAADAAAADAIAPAPAA